MTLNPANVLQTRRGPRKRPQTVNARIVEPHAAFNEISVAELSPQVQIEHIYSVNDRILTTASKGTGSSSISDSLLTVSSGTTTASYELVGSINKAKYHAGQGTLARWTALFDSAGTSGTSAIAGIGNDEDGFFFGYDGTAFGILHRFAGKVEYRTLTFTTGAVTAGGTVTVTLDDVATETEVTNGGSVQAVAREVGATTYVGWSAEVVGASVIFKSHIAEAKSGAFGFADTDTTGVLATAGVVQTVTGVAPTDDWIKQTAWNEDKLDGSGASGMILDVSKGNVYEVQFQWLGFGAIRFEVEAPEGTFIHVHTIEYTNTNTVPVLQNPTLPICYAVKNGGTTTDITVKSSSIAIFTEGQIFKSGPTNSVVGTAAGDLTTETSVLALKNGSVFQGVSNRVNIQPLRLTFSANGTGGAKFTTLKVHIDPVLGGDPVFTDVDTNHSPVSFDVAVTTLSGGHSSNGASSRNYR